MNYDRKSELFIAFCWAVAVGVIWFLLSIYISGCATAPAVAQPPPPKYQLLLSGTIDGVDFQGIAVGSAEPGHQMKIVSPISVNYFTMASCHRSIQFSDVIDVHWYSWSPDSKSFTWTYDEAPTIEDSGDCLLRFCAFSNTIGKAPVACAIVDFKSEKYQLGGTNICNGAVGRTSGTALCTTQVGLIERFKFDEPVVVAPQIIPADQSQAPYWVRDQCIGKFKDAEQTLFEYIAPANECVIIFDTKAKPHRRAKLTVIPWDLPRYPGGN